MAGASKKGLTEQEIRTEYIDKAVEPPTLREAKFITECLRRLMALCDSLEAALRRAEATAEKLADAVVAEIVG